MISFEHISHRYETAQIINDISFNIHSNEVVSLLGPSGCGKTTLLRLAAGLEMPDAGEIKLDDGSIIEYYENLQIRKATNNEIIVQYLKTTTGRVLLNYTIQKTLNFL